MIPQVLAASHGIPESVEKVLMICTAGCIAQMDYLGNILQASERHVRVLPAIADADFRVPARETFEGIGAAELPRRSNGEPRSMEEVAQVLAAIFKEIAVSFSPKTATTTVLEATAARAAQRLASLRTHGSHLTDPALLGARSLSMACPCLVQDVKDKDVNDKDSLEEDVACTTPVKSSWRDWPNEHFALDVVGAIANYGDEY